MNRVLFSSRTGKWNTPKDCYDKLNQEFCFDFDPCPENPSFDGLSHVWGKRNFVNPPYYEIKKWMQKGYEEYAKGNLVVFLVPARTDTIWWHDIVMKYAKEIRFIKGRLKFGNATNSAPFPSCIIIFDKPFDK
mgnify:CR=1 FL=1